MRVGRTSPWLFSSIIAFGPLFTGCGEDSKPKMVVPEQSPAERSKASMDVHKKEMEAAAKKPH